MIEILITFRDYVLRTRPITLYRKVLQGLNTLILCNSISNLHCAPEFAPRTGRFHIHCMFTIHDSDHVTQTLNSFKRTFGRVSTGFTCFKPDSKMFLERFIYMRKESNTCIKQILKEKFDIAPFYKMVTDTTIHKTIDLLKVIAPKRFSVGEKLVMNKPITKEDKYLITDYFKLFNSNIMGAVGDKKCRPDKGQGKILYL